MDDEFKIFLETTISYIQKLKERGVKYFYVEPRTIEALSKPVIRCISNSNLITGSKTKSGENLKLQSQRQEVKGGQNIEPGVGINETEFSPTVDVNTFKKAAALSALRERVLACVKCPHLVSFRHNVVFGVGNINAELMFVGEAPGEDEDLQGEPFVGKAGQLLTKIIKAMGLQREQVYIANILKCRPNTTSPKGNRPPTPEEMQTCVPYLYEQIDIIKPKVIVALGATAVAGLFGEKFNITKIRGLWKEFRDIPVMPTYHPSYLLRNPSITVKREVWYDMLKVMEKLGMPISQKQRDYFSKST